MGRIYVVAPSRDSRWVVTGVVEDNCGELKTCEVEMGIVTKFEGETHQYCGSPVYE